MNSIEPQFQLLTKNMKLLTTRLLLTMMLAIVSTTSLAQSTGNLKGKIIEQSTKQPIAGASIKIDNTQYGAVSDTSGTFSIERIPIGSYSVTISMISYQTKNVTDVSIAVNKTYYAEFELLESAGQLDEVTIISFQGENNPLTPVSTFSYSREELFRNAGSQGDIMRAISVLPGVVSAGSQFSAIAARGQGTQDNVYMVDDIPVFNLSHLEAEGISSGFNDPNGGRFSIFAPRVVDNVQFQNGGFDATFGRRASSYLGLGIKEGNRETTTFSAQVELLGVTTIYDGPLSKKTSIFASARYQNFAGVAALSDIPIGSISLGDYMVKTTSQLNSRNKLSFIAMYNPERPYKTFDDVETGTNLNADNSAGTMLYNHRGSSTLVGLNLRTLTGSRSYWKNVLYFRASSVDNRFGTFTPRISPDGEILDTGTHEDELRTIKNDQQEFGYRSIFTQNFDKLTVTGGVDLSMIGLDYARRLSRTDTVYTFYSTDYRPIESQYFQIVDPASFNSEFDDNAFNGSAYISLSWQLTQWLTLNPGVRYDYTGFTDQHTLSPRLSGNIVINDRHSINFASGIYYQDAAYSNVAGQPSGNDLKNERTIQSILGYKIQFSGDLKFVIEGWHKQFDDLVVQPNRLQSYLTNAGTGYAYGTDVSLIKRLSKKYYGQVSYSYMQSRRDDKDGQGEYDYTFDVPHVLSLLASYKPNNKWIFSAKFRYGTGRPTDEYIVHDNVLNSEDRLRYSQEMTDKNGRRLSDFISLDLRADYKLQMRKSDLTIFADITDFTNRFNMNSESFIPMTGGISRVGLGMFPTFGVKLEL